MITEIRRPSSYPSSPSSPSTRSRSKPEQLFKQHPRPPKIRSSLLETVERAFAFCDEDNSNSIDATEVVNILRALGQDLTRGESRALLRKANVDRNGGVQVRLKSVLSWLGTRVLLPTIGAFNQCLELVSEGFVFLIVLVVLKHRGTH